MKKIAVTLGDPAGIGPEVVIRALPSVTDECIPIVIGDVSVLEDAMRLTDMRLEIRTISSVEDTGPSGSTIRCIDPGVVKMFEKRRPTRENGRACAGYVRRAVELAAAGSVDAIVTAPISKESLRLAGLSWPGHTEMLAELTGTSEYAMMIVGGPLRVILVTIHRSLASVPSLITKERVLMTIRLARRGCAMLGIDDPRIAVAGLNPHAGESGILGTEEQEVIVPAVEAAQREGIALCGLYPPDVVFRKAYTGELDMVVCMYHDQGLIPLKMIAFDKGVNVTVGLPIVRTSPDHGTAYDIAWEGKADPSSMVEAIKLAVKLRL